MSKFNYTRIRRILEKLCEKGLLTREEAEDIYKKSDEEIKELQELTIKLEEMRQSHDLDMERIDLEWKEFKKDLSAE